MKFLSEIFLEEVEKIRFKKACKKFYNFLLKYFFFMNNFSLKVFFKTTKLKQIFSPDPIVKLFLMNISQYHL